MQIGRPEKQNLGEYCNTVRACGGAGGGDVFVQECAFHSVVIIENELLTLSSSCCFAFFYYNFFRVFFLQSSIFYLTLDIFASKFEWFLVLISCLTDYVC